MGCIALLRWSPYFDFFPLVNHPMSEVSTMAFFFLFILLLPPHVQDKSWLFKLMAEKVGGEVGLSGVPGG